jgi:membrane protein involved in colicin uptake
MSDQPTKNQGIASFFEQEQKKKKQHNKQVTEQQKKAEEQKKKAEEEKKAAQTAASAGNGDYESGSEEEDTRGKIEVGAAKIKDMKEVKKAKEAANNTKSSQGFDWVIGGANPLGGGASAETKPKQDNK